MSGFAPHLWPGRGEVRLGAHAYIQEFDLLAECLLNHANIIAQAGVTTAISLKSPIYSVDPSDCRARCRT